MKVLHLTTHVNPGGITMYILRLVEPLREYSVETLLLSSGGEWASSFHKKNVRSFELPIRTKSELHPKLYFALPKLLEIIREEKIDILHAHTRVTQVLAYWAQKCSKIPVVTTCHGFYKRRLGRWLLPAWGDAVVAISHAVGDHLHQDHGVRKEKIHVILNAVDMDYLDSGFANCNVPALKASYGFAVDDPVIGVVSRLVQDKGHEYLIRAIALLKEDLPNIRLLIVGDGKYRPQLTKLVEKCDLKKNVVFTGNLTDVVKPLAVMDIFALPAIWREGFGLSVIEAMALKKPVIVSNIWALNTLIENQVTGILIPPKTVEPLADELRRLLKDPALRQRIGEAGRNMVQEFFSLPRMAQEMDDLYQQMLRNTLTSKESGL